MRKVNFMAYCAIYQFIAIQGDTYYMNNSHQSSSAAKQNPILFRVKGNTWYGTYFVERKSKNTRSKSLDYMRNHEVAKILIA